MMRKPGKISIKTADRTYKLTNLIDGKQEFEEFVRTAMTTGYALTYDDGWLWLSPYHIISVRCDWV